MKKRYWTTCKILILSIIGVFLFGCMRSTPTLISTPVFTPSPEQVDKSPFTGNPCAAPCWYGLEVGKSSKSDVIATLPVLTFINHQTIQTFQVSMPNYDNSASAPGILIEASCANSGQECLTLAVIDNILTKIIVGLNYEMRAEEAIGYLGNPDYVGYDNLGAEKIMCEVYLVWSSHRLVLASPFEDVAGAEKYCYHVRDSHKIPSDLPILEARYLSDTELSAYLSTGTGEFFKFTGTSQDK